jgi:O-antigen ligase
MSPIFTFLEFGLCALILVAPLPFGAVGPQGRLSLEAIALSLTAVWAVAALRRELALPPRPVRWALLGLLAVATLQMIPIGHAAVGLLSPRAEALRAGLDPAPAATLSLAPEATASALRTGTALVGTLLVATSVAAQRGAARIALAATVAAAFQGLYGLLVLASGHAMIWNVPKTSYLDSATGTFINRNHFAGFLAATLPLGVGLVVAKARRARERGEQRRKRGVLLVLGPEGSRALLLALPVAIGLAGLLLSFSRAGIALGLAAIAGTIAVAWRGKPVHRAAAIVLVVAIAAVPLADLGADRLAGRYVTSGSDLTSAGGRLAVWRDTGRMIAAFPLLGCGFGAFNWVFPAFSSPEIKLHYSHAHEDLLQLGAEGGIASLALLATILVALGRAGSESLAQTKDPVATGAVFGLSALLLHGLVDFNFHIPSNAAIAALLAGVLFGGTWNDRS